MKISICGVDCTKCELNTTCRGCLNSDGKPFGKTCIVAKCCHAKSQKYCDNCGGKCEFKAKLIDAFNSLNIKNMDKISELNLLKGSFINLEYTLPSGEQVKFFDDDKIYYGNQVHKEGSDLCYGLVADEHYLLVCEYGEGGSNPQIIVYKRI